MPITFKSQYHEILTKDIRKVSWVEGDTLPFEASIDIIRHEQKHTELFQGN